MRISGRIGIAYLQVEKLRAGIAEELAQAEAALKRRPIESDDALATFASSNEHQRSAWVERLRETSINQRCGGLRPH